METEQKPTDNQLVLMYKNGDEAAFNALFKEYNKTVAAWCNTFVKNDAYAEEIAQDIWLIMSQYLKNLTLDAQFKTLLYKVTQNEIRNWVRDNYSPEVLYTPEEMAALQVYSLDNPEQLMETESFVNDVLELLEPDERTLIVGKIKGYTDEELAEGLGVSIMALKSRLFRARQKIKEIYSLNGEKHAVRTA